MGSALATRLHRSGMTVTIYNRSKHKWMLLKQRALPALSQFKKPSKMLT
ncbi:NAD(P)-binding domain-containing protein [Candidatus Comchoanobacter bicostacola]